MPSVYAMAKILAEERAPMTASQIASRGGWKTDDVNDALVTLEARQRKLKPVQHWLERREGAFALCGTPPHFAVLRELGAEWVSSRHLAIATGYSSQQCACAAGCLVKEGLAEKRTDCHNIRWRKKAEAAE